MPFAIKAPDITEPKHDMLQPTHVPTLPPQACT